MNYDVLRRWLPPPGFAVRFIRNITDIDDKILVKSAEAGVPFWSVAYANERILAEHYAAAGRAAADVRAARDRPRAGDARADHR